MIGVRAIRGVSVLLAAALLAGPGAVEANELFAGDWIMEKMEGDHRYDDAEVTMTLEVVDGGNLKVSGTVLRKAGNPRILSQAFRQPPCGVFIPLAASEIPGIPCLTGSAALQWKTSLCLKNRKTGHGGRSPGR